MARRKIVEIDEEKCDGCGLCVSSCAEGAIRIVGGKARLVSDTYCDGLGACLGHCPRGAITIIQREASEFDEAAAAMHAKNPPAAAHVPQRSCPGSMALDLRQLPTIPLAAPTAAGVPDQGKASNPNRSATETISGLANWPVQLRLVPVQAPYLRGADLLLVADCVPFACADFHQRFLDGRPVAIACPKLDDARPYVDKLAEIIQVARIRRITVVRMEVPCCTGLVRIAQAAIERSSAEVPLDDVTISIRGQEMAPVR